MTGSVEDLIRRAELSERSGDARGAARLWDELIVGAPQHPRAIFIQGRRRVESGEAAVALDLLSRAEALDPAYPEIPLYAAMAHRMLGALPAALAACDRALARDPYFFLALLSKGAILEQIGKPRLATLVYKNAIKIAPPPERLPPSIRMALGRAQTHVAADAQALAAHLRAQTSDLRDQNKADRLDRFDESIDILAGVQPRYVHDPALLYYPRLPAIPFHDREHFPWLGTLEANTEIIKQELNEVLREDLAKFAPYIQYPPEAPVNQWAQLNHSAAWSTFFLWRDGVRQDAHCARCPKTTALLESLPLAHQPGYAPTAMFSMLSPRTHIPPHTGSANTRLIVHLPLILPKTCRFRVGAETRDWRPGKAWVFDDTIEHEAWNDSDETRVILIFDVWNPLLSEAERELIAEMMSAYSAYVSAENAPR
jgi:aspartyl/asparaginyl beta-hydroxylase (cupin superfamily)